MVVLCGTVSWRDAGTAWRQASCFQLLPATGCSFLCSISLLEWYWSSYLTFNKKTNCSFKAFLCTPSYWPTVNVGKCVLSIYNAKNRFILYQEFLLLLMSGNIKMTHKSSSFVNNMYLWLWDEHTFHIHKSPLVWLRALEPASKWDLSWDCFVKSPLAFFEHAR